MFDSKNESMNYFILVTVLYNFFIEINQIIWSKLIYFIIINQVYKIFIEIQKFSVSNDEKIATVKVRPLPKS